VEQSKKVSRKITVFCYVGWNFSMLLLSAMKFIEGDSTRSLIIYLTSMASMNFVFWVLFRMKDKSSEEPEP
jgi:hypothetical protein